WQGSPCCTRGTYAFYKSFSCRGAVAARCPAAWSLGEFYFVRCGPKEPVCLAELTLLWEDQAQHHLLASARLYFLPEDTPKGRSGEHGEDEVLAVSKKIVIRVEDLVKWACQEPSGWKRSTRENSTPNSIGILLSGQPQGASVQSADTAQGVSVKVLSYLQYCRFRSMHKRMQGVAHASSLKDPHLLALGGIRVTNHNTRILYCRDTFNHPTLESNTSIWTEFGCTSLSMKGRPRKRKGREGRGAELGTPDQSEAWIERMKDTVTGSVEEQQDWGALGGQWLPQPEEQHFLEQLYSFMRDRSTPICKVPHLGFKKIDLFLLYSVVRTMGGYETVTEQKLWKHVYNELGGSPGSTSAATCTRRHYERLILAYDRYLKGVEQPVPLPKPRAGAAANEKGKQAKRPAAEPPQKAKKVGVQLSFSVCIRADQQGIRLLLQSNFTRPRLYYKLDQPQRMSNKLSKQSVRMKQGQGREPDSSAGVRIQDLETSSSPALGVLALGLQDDSIPPLAALQKLHPAVGGFSLPQGLSPLDVLRSRLGLGPSSEGPGSVSQEPRKTLVLFQPTVGDGKVSSTPGKEPGAPNPALKPHGAPLAASRGRFPMAPLRIIPLDIDCSLQLMKSSLGHAQLSCFTKKLSEALAQDLSKTPGPRDSVPNTEEQQAVPLNLSKRAQVKRPADCAEPPPLSPYQPSLLHSSYPLYTPQPSQANTAKKLKAEPGPQEQTPAVGQNGKLRSNPAEAEEQPADLSSPRRARAALRDGEERAGEPGLNLLSRPASLTLIPQGEGPSEMQES
ncbi:ARI5B protein, partial [Polyodon spathula]|nr:ARI5B protein [Polyodon spathula]